MIGSLAGPIAINAVLRSYARIAANVVDSYHNVWNIDVENKRIFLAKDPTKYFTFEECWELMWSEPEVLNAVEKAIDSHN